MATQRWRDVWDETRAAMSQLEQSMNVVHQLERIELVQREARICSDGVAKTLSLMREGVSEVRACVHAADLQLSTAVEVLMFDSILDGKEKV